MPLAIMMMIIILAASIMSYDINAVRQVLSEAEIRVPTKKNTLEQSTLDGSPGQTRTGNLEVNSFLLHH